MSLLTLAEFVFFIVYGISTFYHFKYAREITAIAAIVVGVLLVVKLQ